MVVWRAVEPDRLRRMSYELDALIGPVAELQEWRRKKRSAIVVPLAQGLGLVPLTDRLRRALRGQPNAFAAEASQGTIVALVSADYFGGQGSQSAAVFADGQQVASEVEINEALRLLGVTAADGQDEFDTVGLGRYRRTERWFAVATADAILAGPNPAARLVATMLDERASEMVREQAAAALGKLGGAGSTAVSVLAAKLRADGDHGVKIEAAGALAAIGGDGLRALVHHLESLDHHRPSDHWPILNGFGEAGERAADAVPAVARCLQSRDSTLRRDAVHCLGRIGAPAAAVLPAMVGILDDSDRLCRSRAAEAIGMVGRGARDAMPRLGEALGDECEYVRENAARALAAIGASIDADGTDAAGGADGAGGMVETVVLPAITPLLRDRHTDVAAGVVEALAELGPRARPAVDALIRIVERAHRRLPGTRDNYVREAACGALVRIDPGSLDVVRALLGATRARNWGIRRAAARALGTLGPALPEVVPALVALLGGRSPNMVVADAADALGSIGPPARSALQALRKLTDHASADVRKAAGRAIALVESPE